MTLYKTSAFDTLKNNQDRSYRIIQKSNFLHKFWFPYIISIWTWLIFIDVFLSVRLNLTAKETFGLWIISDAASGWAGWALAHSEFGSSFNPITTRGADYAHHITVSPPGFENPVASLIVNIGLIKKFWLHTIFRKFVFPKFVGFDGFSKH